MGDGLLPQTRPTQGNYGPRVKNEIPVKRPDYEIDADNINKMTADLAFVGQVSPLAILFIKIVTGAAVLVRTWGVENPSLITVSKIGPGVITISIDPALGIQVGAATMTSNTIAIGACVTLDTVLQVSAYTLDSATLAPTDAVDGITVSLF